MAKEPDVRLYAVGVFIVVIGMLTLLPTYEHVTPSVQILDAQVSSKDAGSATVAVTISWVSPFTGSCFLANDIRPAGAPKGTPETAEWSQYHLIRYNLQRGSPLTEYWINIEVLNQNKNTQTLSYIIVPPTTNALDIYSTLQCDDDVLAETAKANVPY